MEKPNLKGLTLKELEQFATSVGEQKYRGRQLFDWLYAREAASFAEMTSLSKPFRAKLEAEARIDSLKLVEVQTSSEDGTAKYLFQLPDAKQFESVLIPPRTAFSGADARAGEEQTRMTLCVSTQVGCPLDCKFCATATMGFLRNLSAGEIIDQVIQVKKISGKKITNLVYMGMGEPLLNYEHSMNSAEIIANGLNIAAKRIAISTAGWVPGIRRMADEQRKMKLAVSLHSLDDDSRSELMPVNKRFPLGDLLDAVSYYYSKTRTRVTFEYILFDRWNDSDEDIKRLTKLSRTVPCKINIIPFHSIAFTGMDRFAGSLRPTPHSRMTEFVEQLRSAHATVFVRSNSGEDIDAACGQLAVKHERKSTPAPEQILT